MTGPGPAGRASASLPPSVLGIACMVAGGFCLVVQDAIIKWLTGDYPVGEIMFVRGLFATLLAAAFVWRSGGLAALRPAAPWKHVLRVLCVVGTTVTFINAMRLLPLATAITVTFAGPLFITAMAPRFLGEHVGWRRWSAVGVGFLGVVVIFRPGIGGGFDWVLAIPLATALIGAVRDIVTRNMSARESTAAMLFYSVVAVTLTGAVTLPWAWQPPSLADLGLFAVTGVLIGGAHYFLIQAFRYAEAATVAPFKYLSVVWGAAIGYAVWGDVPDPWSVAGAALIVGSGLYILHRETARRRA